MISDTSNPQRPDSSGVSANTVMERTTRGAAARTRTVRDLSELISALDRRVPQIERSGEVPIARAAAALRAEAVKRIADLEREAETGPVHLNAG